MLSFSACLRHSNILAGNMITSVCFTHMVVYVVIPILCAFCYHPFGVYCVVLLPFSSYTNLNSMYYGNNGKIGWLDLIHAHMHQQNNNEKSLEIRKILLIPNVTPANWLFLIKHFYAIQMQIFECINPLYSSLNNGHML